MIKNDVPITIHVGLPKTGSTSMQQGFWSRIPSLDYVGPNFEGNEKEKAINSIVSLEGLEFEQRREDFKEKLSTLFCSGLPTLISNERLTQGTVSLPTLVPFCDRLTVAHRLRDLLPEAQILLVLRNQPALLLSLFGERLKGPHIATHPFKNWFELQKINRDSGLGNFFDVGNFFLLFTSYQKLFGPENVKVVLFEEFVENPEEFFRDTMEYIGLSWNDCKKYWKPIHGNSRVSQQEIVLQKLMWRFPKGRKLVPRKVRHWARDLAKMSTQIRPGYTDAQVSYLEEIFSEGNRRLQRVTGLPLESFGYPL